MIAPLRGRHRLMIGLIAPLVIVLFVLALKARPSLPVMDEPPAALVEPSPGDGEVLFERPELFSRPAIAGRVRATATGLQLELEPREAPRLPSVLVYWTAAASPPSIADLASARLLGPLDDTRTQVFPLPDSARGGYLVLYSLGHQELVASAELPELASAGSPSAEPGDAATRTDDSEAPEGSEEQGSAEKRG